MNKDIEQRKVTDVVLAIVPPEVGGVDEELWDVYLINLKKDSLTNVLISACGYGSIDGEARKTTTLRYFFEEIGPSQIVQIEPIQRVLFDLTNDYWVSFNLDNYMYDRHFVFVSGSVHPVNFTTIPFLSRKGVMIR